MTNSGIGFGVVRLGLKNGVRVISTHKVGRYAVIITDTNHKHVSRVVGRRNAIRAGQHASVAPQLASRR